MRAYEDVFAQFQDIRAIQSSISLLNWDQQLLMPPGGLAARSEHLLRLTKIKHLKLTNDDLVAQIHVAMGEATDLEEAQLRTLLSDINKAKKLPIWIVQRKAAASSSAYHQWRISRANNDFASMIPHYTELFDIARESAELYGYKHDPYDALIDLYEEGSTLNEAKSLFEDIKKPTIDLIQRIKEDGISIPDDFLIRDWDQPRLKIAIERVINQIGFNLDCGRLDIAANAFCTNLSVDDVRMTTRPSDHFRGIVSSTLHEMGHGLYEQNQRKDWESTPICGGVSLAVHESQSRTWENVIGRSKPFWDYFWIWFREQFAFLKEVETDQFWRAYNKVEPSLIRVGSDELHYNLHILIRFEIEADVIANRLAVKDIPDAWNSKYQEYLGVSPSNDAEGCLQDVHWSRGSAGYFPTYTYGNLIGVQIWNCLMKEVDDVDELMATGNYRPILDWLVERVYGYGRLLRPKDLIQRIAGEPISAKPWMDYATKKFTDVYKLQ